MYYLYNRNDHHYELDKEFADDRKSVYLRYEVFPDGYDSRDLQEKV